MFFIIRSSTLHFLGLTFSFCSSKINVELKKVINIYKQSLRKRPCPEICSAHAQPEVSQYPPLFTGSDVSCVTGSCTDRKCAHAPVSHVFSYSSSSTKCKRSTMATEGHPKGWWCAHAQPEVAQSASFDRK